MLVQTQPSIVNGLRVRTLRNAKLNQIVVASVEISCFPVFRDGHLGWSMENVVENLKNQYADK